MYMYILQGLLLNVIEHQPEDPITYFHEEITKIKKEMEDSNVSRFVWSCMAIHVQTIKLIIKGTTSASQIFQKAEQSPSPQISSPLLSLMTIKCLG